MIRRLDSLPHLDPFGFSLNQGARGAGYAALYSTYAADAVAVIIEEPYAAAHLLRLGQFLDMLRRHAPQLRYVAVCTNESQDRSAGKDNH